ncbi:DUF3307 domain-containing protein [Limnoglobus roseus]|uniref:DUF3307 domain-containing protein n=1 Tax=Limnoglobus roseus TaxID=2598579 RepID=A0A5C1ADA8_9BACT|nr:DUF3307 domain-containing protein [Limnoglobus roseus]QEL15986.1 hypothetical protein PX52LOC_02923 [Limnoglobus roseus]
MLFFLFFFLLAGHALMDFALQGDAIAVCKCRKANSPLQKSVPWYYWMFAHAILHGATVGVVIYMAGGFTPLTITAYATVETVVHGIADVLKCEGYTSIHVDQAFHVVCKLAWALMLVNGVTLAA